VSLTQRYRNVTTGSECSPNGSYCAHKIMSGKNIAFWHFSLLWSMLRIKIKCVEIPQFEIISKIQNTLAL